MLLASWYCVTLFRGYSSLGDGNDYAGLARSLARGNGFSLGNVYSLGLVFNPHVPQPDNHWAPGYPAYLSLWFLIWGPNDIAALAGAIGALSLFVVATNLLGRHIGGGVFGACAAILIALNQGVLRVVIGGLSEPLAGGLLTLAVVPLLPSASVSRVVASAVLFGLATLTRYQLVIVMIPLALCFIGRRPRMLGLWLAVVGTTVAPWLLRNAVVLGSPVMTLHLYGEFTTGMPRFDDFYFTYRSLTPMTLGYALVQFPDDVARKFADGLLYFAKSLPLTLNVLGMVPFLAVVPMFRRLTDLEKSVVAFTYLSLTAIVALSSLGGHFDRHLLPLQGFFIVTALIGVRMLVRTAPLAWRRTILLLAGLALMLPARSPGQERILLAVAQACQQARSQYIALAAATDPRAVIISDASDAVWWYADRNAIWLPVRNDDFLEVVVRSQAEYLYFSAPGSPPDTRLVWDPVAVFPGPGRLYRLRR